MSFDLSFFVKNTTRLCWVSHKHFQTYADCFIKKGMRFVAVTTEDPYHGFSIYVPKNQLAEYLDCISESLVYQHCRTDQDFELVADFSFSPGRRFMLSSYVEGRGWAWGNEYYTEYNISQDSLKFFVRKRYLAEVQTHLSLKETFE